MIIAASQNEFENPPAGVHIARCYRLIDLGTQKSTYLGEVKNSRKLLLSFELLGDERMNDGRPFTISRRFTASMGDKSALKAFAEAWRGRSFTPDELAAGFDLSKMVGAFGLLNLMDTERDGRTYSNIASISPLPKTMPRPEGENPAATFDFSAPDWAVFNELSDRLKEQISASPEYKAARQAAPVASDIADDEIPF